jgi:integrase
MTSYNIYHRQDGRYEGRISKGKCQNGRRKFQYFFGRSREEVMKKIDDSRGKADVNVCGKTLGQVFAEWFLRTKHKVKESTAAGYRMKADKHVLPSFSTRSIDDMTEADVYSFIEEKQKIGLSNRYISDILIMMKSIFKYAVKNYHIFNPMADISMPKAIKSEITLLDDKQQVKLQRYVAENPSNTTLGVALSMSTGIRIGELCALQWEDVDLEKRILTVRKTIQRIMTPDDERKTKLIITEPKSESSKRKIPIPECMIPMLETFRGEAEEYIVSGISTAVEPRTMQNRFARILKNVKLPSIHFHALRHMFASKCVKLGFDIKTLSEILGHSSVEITLNRYVHSSFDQKREYMKRLDMVF